MWARHGTCDKSIVMSVEPAALSQIGAIDNPSLSKPFQFWTSAMSKAARIFRLPADIWARALTIFLILAGIKTALLGQFGKHLFETHWRVGVPEITTAGYAAFAVFIALGVLSLWRLGRECQRNGISSLRLVNAIVLLLGFAFIFLTFHGTETNYLFPILTGVLPWGSLGPYVSLDLCFRQPFLAGWILGYVFCFYFLVRAGREKWSVYFTAAVAGIYAAINLRGLAVFGDELILIDTIGLVCLALSWKERSKPGWYWLFAPVLWSTIGALAMLHLAPSGMGLSFTYFWILAGCCGVLFAGTAVLLRQRGSVLPWSRYLFFYFAGFLLLANTHHPIAPNFNRALCWGLGVSHYFAGEILAAAALAIACVALRKLLPRIPLWCMDLAGLVLIGCALVDFRLSQLLGVRLGWDVIALGGTPKMMWRMARPHLPSAILILAVLALLYALMVRGLQGWLGREFDFSGRHSDTLASGHAAKDGPAYCWTMFLALGVAGLVTSNPDKAENQVLWRLIQGSPVWKMAFNRPMARDEFFRQAAQLGMSDLSKPAMHPAGPPRDLNVVLVFMESTYNEHLSLFSGVEQTQPLLSQYQDRMELFPNFFSNFASSIHARFATFTSLYPVQDYNEFTLHRVPVKSMFEVMHDSGYSCSLFYSSYLDFTGFRNLLANRGLDELYDADTMPGQRKTEPVSWGLREEETLEAMRGNLKQRAADGKRFFLTYVPAAPHYPYEKVPERFRKFKVGEVGDYKPLYLNELLYMDWVLASLIDELKTNGLLEKTLVIITDDHGEMLGGKGSAMGHGWWLTPKLVNAPLIVMDPEKKGARINQAVGSQVDLLPTLLDLLRLPQPEGELYEGHSLYAATGDSKRTAWLNSFQQYAILRGNSLVFGDREKAQGKNAVEGNGFQIRNDGARTLFEETGPCALPGSIKQFDRFQENLLKNYSYYTEPLKVRSPQKLAQAKKQ
jgi:hypothetical protein